MNTTLGSVYLKELEAEAAATRHCLERVTPETFDFKPHEKSMVMGYLAQLVAEIPTWVADEIEVGEIDLATYPHQEVKGAGDLLALFDAGMERARTALAGISDDDMLNTKFELKSGDMVLMSDPKDVAVSSTINHLVHHRGQLTVYLRLNDIKVPSIYGPSADQSGF